MTKCLFYCKRLPFHIENGSRHRFSNCQPSSTEERWQGELVLPPLEKCFPHIILCHDWAPPTWAGRLFPMTGRHLQYLHITRVVYLHKVPNALRCGFSCCICFDAKSTNGRKNLPILNVPGSSLISCLGKWGLSFKKQIFIMAKTFCKANNVLSWGVI